ncbi:RAB40C, member RAS oncogene family [Phyllostomus discolor]|uniref:small monomeric GTPase n=1 Tax=Phyllostomus discolor TaxID=89673 RepID=A0A834EUG2_9CHIR|nr:RAB40C, member RAS oncogene family [Phyllostomus discolor]
MGTQGSPVKSYDYLLKFLLVGDSDVGKGEILESLQDGAAESPYAYSNGIDYKTTTILLDGRRVKLELWDTSGQGRFCTIFRSYSRGAQGILLVYDITNRWSFDGIDRWIKEIDEVGIPEDTPSMGTPFPGHVCSHPPLEPLAPMCCLSFLTLITVALEGQGLMPQKAMVYGSEPYLVIESGDGDSSGAGGILHSCLC